MTDETETQPQGSAPAATEAAPAAEAQPATTAPVDVESIVSARLSEWEKDRIAPLQRLISERDDKIKELKTASMSEEDRAQLEITEQERERRQFETERWLFKKAKENPKAADFIEKFIGLEDPDEQFALAASVFAIATPETPVPAAPEASEQVPDIDPNNPARAGVPVGTPIGPEGQVLDKEFRAKYLKSLEFWPEN